ncbi:MAG: hypothetical protein ABL921_29145 [Pirellula sp.]
MTTAVERGVEYLLRHQHLDGTWSSANANPMYRVAITSLAARSLHLWARKLKPELGERARTASEKATMWLNKEVKLVEPESFNSFGAAYVVDYFIDLEETKATVRGDVKTAVHLLQAGQMENGAWSYTYPEPRSFNQKPEYSIGRASLCEHVLQRLTANDEKDLEESIQLFMTHRAELRPVVKLTEGWMSKVGSSSYFYFYAYEHAARAIVYQGNEIKERLAILRDDLLKVSEADGSWVDFEAIGKPYGTAMAL